MAVRFDFSYSGVTYVGIAFGEKLNGRYIVLRIYQFHDVLSEELSTKNVLDFLLTKMCTKSLFLLDPVLGFMYLIVGSNKKYHKHMRVCS